VHVFKPVGYSGLAAIVLSALGVPWVLDVDDWEGPGGWVDVNLYSPAEKLAISIMDAVLPRMAGTVTVASRTLQARTWGFGLSRHRVFYLPNGVSAYRYGAWSAMSATRTTGARSQPLSAGRPSILLYTRFAEFPYQWPLEVLRLVLAHHPTARLLVVGEGFFDEEHRLYSEATRTGIHRHIDITGRVSEQDLPAYLSSADVCIYPMEDNLINRAKSPVKLLEVMLLGVPVVAHRVGEVGEFVGDAGVLVRPADLPGMAIAVSDLLRDPARRQALGERARRRVWSRFNWQDLCAVAEAAYQQRAKWRGAGA
jgi:glycosyltransferase involved in cell wall biosynthesis